jgi:site-specific DNA-cytosine methylase
MPMTMQEREYTVFFPFCGIGGGAVGFAQARAQMEKLGLKGRFKILGGFDLDAGAARDFETLTGAPCLVADVRELTPEMLRAFCRRRPDVIFDSSPCCGASGLLSNEMAETEKYKQMNELLLVWTRLMLATWGDDLPLLNIKENVPRLATRAKDVLQSAVKLLQAAGYAVHAGNHNCGELGGLAQNRVRFLMVARHLKKVSSLLYQPPRQRVRGCGEVIGPLPPPNDPAGGAMHQLPDICTTNWLRLALIPPGGDWRDIDGALAAHEKRHEHWSRYHVARFDLATPTVAGAGTNGAWGVADARVEAEVRGAARVPNAYPLMYGVLPWQRPCVTITGRPHLSNGMFSVADARVPSAIRGGSYSFTNELMLFGWTLPARTITGATHIGNGVPSLDDVRVPPSTFQSYGVLPFALPAPTITGNFAPGGGYFSVDDVRVPSAYPVCYGLVAWASPFGTITGHANPSGGSFSLVDVRLTCDVRETSGVVGVLDWWRPSYTITAWGDVMNGRFAVADVRPMVAPEVQPEARAASDALTTGRASRRRKVKRYAAPGDRVRSRGGRARLFDGIVLVADPRVPGNPALPVLFAVTKLNQAPLFVPVLATESGAWHRPLTLWERFALQGFPLYDAAGHAFVLSGQDVTEWSRRIGNAVPPPAARAIAEQMLTTLLCAEAEVFALSSGGGAWVRGKPAPTWMRVLGVADLYPPVDERACGSLAVIEPGDPWATLVAAGTAPSTEVLQ